MFNIYLIEALKDRISSTEFNTINDSGSLEDKSYKLDKHLMTNRKDANLKKSGVGTSRIYYKVKSPENITLDGEHTTIHTGIKVPYLGSLDDGYRAIVGLEQNKGELSKEYEPYHIIKKDSLGNYHTNHDTGILAPTIDKGEHWNEMIHTEKLSDTNRLEHYTKTKTHPEGLKHSDMNNMLDAIYTWKQTKFSPEDQHTLEHPLMKKVLNLIDNTKISHHDISTNNMGIWEHPITKEKHPVIIDYGIHKGMFTYETNQ